MDVVEAMTSYRDCFPHVTCPFLQNKFCCGDKLLHEIQLVCIHASCSHLINILQERYSRLDFK